MQTYCRNQEYLFFQLIKLCWIVYLIRKKYYLLSNYLYFSLNLVHCAQYCNISTSASAISNTIYTDNQLFHMVGTATKSPMFCKAMIMPFIIVYMDDYSKKNYCNLLKWSFTVTGDGDSYTVYRMAATTMCSDVINPKQQ